MRWSVRLPASHALQRRCDALGNPLQVLDVLADTANRRWRNPGVGHTQLGQVTAIVDNPLLLLRTARSMRIAGIMPVAA